ncbi:MAG: RNA polymerase sigma factor [candidate division WOR-3 bacterium]
MKYNPIVLNNHDQETIKKAQAGELGAFRILYDKYKHQIYQYLRARIPNPEDAQDLLAETLSRALLKINTLKNPQAFRSWLYRIAQNELRKYWRTKARQITKINMENLPEPKPASNPNPDARSLAVREALSKLSAEEQKLIYQRYCLALTISELSELTGKSPEQIKYQLRRAKKKFWKYYSAKYPLVKFEVKGGKHNV